MMVKQTLRSAALGLAVLFFVAGCADGVLFEKQHGDGGVQRLRLDSSDWNDYDTTPRSRSSKAKDQDGYGIVLKNEMAF